ncbi:hypothetical protein ABID42_003139 [Arcicella rosea]|uniref:hypothetical protein n=1 Tax=Arcicella rosea TaxID=502909 RepID=UPI00345D8667
MEKKNAKQEGNQYDKIVKENIDSIIPALMNNILGFKVKDATVIKEKIQQTKEKEADALRIITAPNGEKFILHLEFQVDDYPKMIYRMADYWILLKSKYHLPVRQFVIFMGNKEPKMKNVLSEDANYFQFQLINIGQFNYLRFLMSDNPEEIILSILSDFGEEKIENALSQIISRLEETTSNQLTFQKYLRQLRVLSKLRKLTLKFDDMIHNMAKYIDAENDYLYIRGKQEEQVIVVGNLLTQTDFDVEKIANIANVSIDFVKNIQEKQKNKS